MLLLLGLLVLVLATATVALVELLLLLAPRQLVALAVFDKGPAVLVVLAEQV
jgi:hypothetical protein